MVAVINDPWLEEHIIAERRASGADRYDEVWEGVYIMTPLANNEHQKLITGITTVLATVVQWEELGTVFPGINVSDREDDWIKSIVVPMSLFT